METAPWTEEWRHGPSPCCQTPIGSPGSGGHRCGPAGATFGDHGAEPKCEPAVPSTSWFLMGASHRYSSPGVPTAPAPPGRAPGSLSEREASEKVAMKGTTSPVGLSLTSSNVERVGPDTKDIVQIPVICQR
uniref:Uncharacterized protein n=1 Tax=Knipowitschia caucasica TaxID=637954 RepID=A0AAV2KVN6_KNICA